VDSGCWGSIVKDLHLKTSLQFQPLFFYSHNPNIQGFLNELNIDDKTCELLNDSMECCFINTITRSTEFKKDENLNITPIVEPLDSLSIALGNELLSSISKNAESFASNSIGIDMAVEKILEACINSKNGVFNGILSKNSPTWSEGKVFLKTWPKNLNWKGINYE
jgi:hypothetical protein